MNWDWNSWQQWASGWINWLVQDDQSMHARLSNLEQGQERMSAELDALRAAFEAYKTDVTVQLGNLLSSVKKLTDQITADSTDSAAIQALTAEISAAQSTLDSMINPPLPTPAPVPTPAPSTGS